MRQVHWSPRIQIVLALIIVPTMIMLLPAGAVLAATYLTHIERLPGTPVYTQNVRVWINSDTEPGETVVVEYKIGSNYVKVDGTYDAVSHPGANWYADIPAQAIGTYVEYQLINRNQSNVEYRYSGFNWNYTVAGLPSTVYVDDSWAGTMAGADPDGAGPATNFGGDAFTTTQDGVNGVAAGGTVNVAAGTYVENINVSKGVTLQGDTAPTSATPVVVEGRITVSADDVTVQQFKVTPGTTTGPAAAIQVSASSTTIAHNVITDMSGFVVGTIKGIWVYNAASTPIADINLTENAISGITNTGSAADGIMIQGVVEGVSVYRNTISSITAGGWAYGIEVTPTDVDPWTSPADINIQENILSTINNVPYQEEEPHLPYPGTGVIIGAAGTPTTPHPANASEAVVFNNSFSNIPVPVLNLDVAHVLNASGNYLGLDPVVLRQAILTQDPTNGALLLNALDYTPWLDSGTEVDGATPGFQGDFSTLWVTANDGQTGTVGRIQEGVNLATGSAPTVNVLAGTYDENVVANKAVTLTGAAGAIIDGAGNGVVVTITTDDVTLQGFTIRNSESAANSAGVFLNGASDCTVANNTITGNANGILMAVGSGNAFTSNVVNTNLAYGIAVVAGTGNTINLNTVTGNGLDAIALENASAVGGPVTAGSTGNFILENTISSNRDGVFLGENCDGNTVDGNTLSSITSTGVSAWRSDGHTITDNTIGGAAIGLRLLGSSNNTITGNTLSGNAIGVKVDASSQLSILYQSANNAIHQNNLAGTTSFAVNCGVEQTAQVDATMNWWGAATGPATGQVSGNVLTCPWLNDVPGTGIASANLVTNADTSEGFCTIQAAIDDAQTLNGHTINVSAGTYRELIDITKSVTLIGQGTVVIQPSENIPDFTSNHGGAIIWIKAADVVISNLEVNGDNPDISGGYAYGGADINAVRGIYMNGTFYNNARIEGVALRNLGRGINLYGGQQHTILDNTAQNLGGPTDNYGYGILLMGNSSATITDNDVNGAMTAGIFMQNNYSANATTIAQNTILNSRIGLGWNMLYGGATGIVEDNIVEALELGMQVTSITNGYLEVRNNTFNFASDNDTYAFIVWNTAPDRVLITSNSITDGEVGVDLYNADASYGNAQAYLRLTNNDFEGTLTAINVSSDSSAHNVNLRATGNTIMGAQVGVNLGGAQANSAVSFAGNTLNDVDTVFTITNGDFVAYANNITNFTDGGLTSATGTFNARHNWWGTHATQPTGVDNDSWNYRLGAPVASWSDGSGSATLGGASLTGTGTGVIVSHGRGLANVPFGKGNDPYASAMCSDYYDLFVLNGSGNWTAVVPVDAGAACDVTFNTGKLYHFTLTGDMPDTTCSGSGCWNVPAGTTGASRTLQVTLDADTLLQGTPFIAGSEETGTDPGGMDPTMVTLAAFDAAPQGEAILVTWETATELENLGFNLYRGESASGPWVKLNAELLAAQNPGAVFGASYEWLDSEVTSGTTVYYRLEDVDVSGASTFHGPVSATPAEPSAVHLVDFSAQGSVAQRVLALLITLGSLILWNRRNW